MNNVTSLAIDLAKNVFQLHGINKEGKTVLKKKIGRAKLKEFMVNLPLCNIYMEGCGSANYWGREFEKMGHKVKLMNPKYVKPYVKRNKNDVNDAAGIAAAASAPGMRFCAVKTEAQQDVQSVHRMRELLVEQRTAMANQARGLLSEYGIVVAQGIDKLRRCIENILGDNPKDMNAAILICLTDVKNRLDALDRDIATQDELINKLFKGNEICKRLATIPGIGKLGATILASILGNGTGFKNGRHFAAFLGLVPKQHSSGGKERLLGISKGGDTYARTLLIHGGRAVLRWVAKKNDNLSQWLKKMVIRRGKNRTAVALANKIARIAWAVVYRNKEYVLNFRQPVNNVKKYSAT